MEEVILYELIDNIKLKLRPIKDYLLIIRDEKGLIKHQGIGLKQGISFNQLKNFGYIAKNTTKNKFIELLDWFNDNLKEFEFALKDLEENK